MNFNRLRQLGFSALLLALAACGSSPTASNPQPQVSPTPTPPPPPPPAVGSFSLSTLETLTLKRGKGANLTVLLARNSFPHQVSLTLKSAPAGVGSDLPKVSAGNEVGLTLAVTAEAALGTHDLVFEAAGNGVTKSATLKLTVEAADPPAPHPSPTIDLVRLEGFGGGKQVRQGQGNVVLVVEGRNLSSVTAATLERKEGAVGVSALAVTLPVSILSKTNTALRLQATVAHGAPIGDYDIGIVNGAVTKADAVMTVTAIRVAPTGNDATGRGTSESPFRSLTKAVSVATSADQILLRQGDYNIANGEIFPINVAGMNIQGQGKQNTVLSGVGGNSDCLQVVGVGADTRIANLQVHACEEEGIQLEDGTTVLDRVALQENKANGLRLTGTAQVTILESDFYLNTTNGISAQNSAQIVFEGNPQSTTVNNGQSGIQLITGAKLSGRRLLANGNTLGLRLTGSQVTVALQESTLAQNTSHGIWVQNAQEVQLQSVSVLNSGSRGIYVNGNASLELRGVEIAHSGGDGINVDASASKLVELRLDTVRVRGSGESGIEYRSANPAGRLWMTESDIADNDTYGLYIAGVPSNINLGQLVPANNRIFENGNTALVDARAAGTGSIPANGTDFMVAGALVNVSGNKAGPDSQLPLWQVVNAGNSINFGP